MEAMSRETAFVVYGQLNSVVLILRTIVDNLEDTNVMCPAYIEALYAKAATASSLLAYNLGHE